MKKSLLTSLLLLVGIALASAAEGDSTIVRLDTSMGTIRIALSNATPQHRDNFIRLVTEGFYDGTTFHRVVRDFMIQGGDDNSRVAADEQPPQEWDMDYTLPAEIRLPELFHKRGAVAAAREGDSTNPDHESNANQFYIVCGKKVHYMNIEELREEDRQRGIELTDAMSDAYQRQGGIPSLDGLYTVFGNVVEGLDVVDAIQHVVTDDQSRPVEDVVILKATVE